MKKQSTMKIQLLSDTHDFDYIINEHADVIVHAGDFSNNMNGAMQFIKQCQALHKDFVFVLGNHDYYDTNIDQTVDFLIQNYPQHFLSPKNPIKIQGYTFVGGTLFSNFRANRLTTDQIEIWQQHQKIAQDWVLDFKKIRSGQQDEVLTPQDYVAYFDACLAHILQYKDQDKVVVVTHFPPHLACLDPFWGNHPATSLLNPYFINDLEITGFKTWLCGHTHTAVDTVVEGCRLVINPLGYAREHGNNGYRADLIIEV